MLTSKIIAQTKKTSIPPFFQEILTKGDFQRDIKITWENIEEEWLFLVGERGSISCSTHQTQDKKTINLDMFYPEINPKHDHSKNRKTRGWSALTLLTILEKIIGDHQEEVIIKITYDPKALKFYKSCFQNHPQSLNPTTQTLTITYKTQNLPQELLKEKEA